MIILNKQIQEIRTQFGHLKTKDDLLSLLNTANSILYGDKVKDFQLKSLTFYTNPNLSGNNYKQFSISKKSGGERQINAPVKGLKVLQQALNFVLQAVFEPHKAATGFVPNKSIVDNARKHVGNHYVFNTDLKDFFFSIDQARFWGRLKNPPFNFNNDTNSQEVADRIVALCFSEFEVERLDDDGVWVPTIKSVLPQGAPTSPTISNIIAEKLDRKLTGLADRFGCVYTRYADDITFSSQHNVYKKNGVFISELKRIIESQNFNIKESKTRLKEHVYRQEVTGLTVNEKVNVPRRYVKTLRMWLYYWEKYGQEKAEEIFNKDYGKDKGHLKDANPSMEMVIWGKLQYLKMVKGEMDSTFKKLYDRFEKLTKSENLKKVKSDSKKPMSHENRLKVANSDIRVLPPTLVKYTNPINTARFLNEFNQNIFLKSTSHLIDENLLDEINSQLGLQDYDYNAHIDRIIKEFNHLKKKYTVGKSLIGLIEEYLTGRTGKGWSKHNIKVGWCSNELKNWCKINPGKCPNPDQDLKYAGFQLNEVLELQDHEIGNFNEVVLQFKNQTQFRDESDLKKIIEYINKEEFKDYDIDIKNMDEGVRIYTIVDNIEAAYKKLINMCIKEHTPNSEQSEKPSFRISLKEFTNVKPHYVVFRIWHLNSIFNKSVKSLDRYGNDFTGIINKQLNGFCDWHLKAHFVNNDYAMKSIWPREDAKLVEHDDYTGVQFDLKFYRTS